MLDFILLYFEQFNAIRWMAYRAEIVEVDRGAECTNFQLQNAGWQDAGEQLRRGVEKRG